MGRPKVPMIAKGSVVLPLYAHQVEGAKSMRNGNFACWWEPGLGKTRATLVAFRHLLQAHDVDMLIVVCPKIAKNVWAKEIDDVGLVPPWIISGTAPEELAFNTFQGIIVINFDILWHHKHQLMEIMRRNRAILCFDESHHLRNRKIKRYKAAAQISVFAERVWELSGTPLVNGALDIYHQLRLIGPDFPFWKISERRFGSLYCYEKLNPFASYYKTEYYGLKHEDRLMDRLNGLVDRKMKVDCLDLPDKLRVPMWLAKQEHLGVEFSNGNAAAALGTARAALSPLKAQLVIDYLEQELESRPVVVYGYHHDFLNRVGKHFEAPIISGETSLTDRNRFVNAFQAGEIPILVAQLQAAGQAITLHKGSHAVFGEIHWSAVDHRQAEDRLHRIGMGNQAPTYHYVMVENSVDELVWQHVLRKGEAIDRLDDAATGLQEIMPLFHGIEGQ